MSYPRRKYFMKRIVTLVFAVLCFAAPSLMAQAVSGGGDHIEVGVFGDYFKLSRTSPDLNLVGLGARAGFNVHSHVQLEAEMAYDFERGFLTTFSNGFTTQLVDVRTRTLHGLFGPKFQTNAGPLRAFAT